MGDKKNGEKEEGEEGPATFSKNSNMDYRAVSTCCDNSLFFCLFSMEGIAANTSF